MGLTEKDLRNFSPEAKQRILEQILPPKKENKYHNVKTEVNGIRFDSAKEAKRYQELMLLLKAGKIRKLKLQPEFTLQEAFVSPYGDKVQAITYRADFSYYRVTQPDTYGYTHWIKVVEDVKGVRTPEYKLKAKRFLEKYGFAITEI